MSHPLSFIAEIAHALEHRYQDELADALRRAEGDPSLSQVARRQFCQFVDEIRANTSVGLRIEKHHGWARTVAVEEQSRLVVVGALQPGTYAITLATGRLLWEGPLSETDLFWERAFPTENLPLAADTADALPPHSRTETLISGELTMFVFPGLRSGAIGIQLEAPLPR